LKFERELSTNPQTARAYSKTEEEKKLNQFQNQQEGARSRFSSIGFARFDARSRFFNSSCQSNPSSSSVSNRKHQTI